MFTTKTLASLVLATLVTLGGAAELATNSIAAGPEDTHWGTPGLVLADDTHWVAPQDTHWGIDSSDDTHW